MKRIFKQLGNIFILISTGLFIYIYLPVIKLEIEYQLQKNSLQPQIPKSLEFGLVIPSLGINQIVTPNVDPHNPTEYLPVLNHSIAHASTSSLPDQPGNVYLFAHSSDNPLSITRYNTAFYLIDKLKPGDKILLYYQGQQHKYLVTDTQIVKPSRVDLLTQTNPQTLTLQTCTPVGTSINRLIVTAKQI